jgi:pilus assembly protein TadC
VIADWPAESTVLCGLGIVGCSAAAAGLLVARRARRGSRRLRRLRLSGWPSGAVAGSVQPDGPSSRAGRAPVRRWWRPDRIRLVAVVAGAAVALVVGGWAGLVAGVLAALVVDRWVRRLEPRAVRQARVRARADLPFALDLMAAALLAGAPPGGVCVAVGQALGGPLGERLSRVGRALALGTPTAEAWAPITDLPAGDRLAAAAVRTSRSGAALAGALLRLAADLRSDRLAELESAGQRASVLVVLPLGLCFLPAFVLGGLVPVVVSMLGNVLP